jgi:hypothetical protein
VQSLVDWCVAFILLGSFFRDQENLCLETGRRAAISGRASPALQSGAVSLGQIANPGAAVIGAMVRGTWVSSVQYRNDLSIDRHSWPKHGWDQS